MRNLLLKMAYVGTNYHGFQIQQNAVSVQQVFQQALKTSLGELPDIKGCSRTDSGVHAREYCVSFKTASDIEEQRLVKALNFHLPRDIRVFFAREVPDDFHARYSAKAKQYEYLVCNSRVLDPFLNGRALHFIPKLDERQLSSAAARFVGEHDFYPFSGSKRSGDDTVRTVSEFLVTRRGETVSFEVTADGFLYNMVRIMVGSLLSVARGKLSENDIDEVFKARERPNECFTAAAHGLYLKKVFY